MRAFVPGLFVVALACGAPQNHPTQTDAVSASFAVPKETHWELPLHVARELLPASSHTLFAFEPPSTIEEIDAAKLTVVRARTLDERGAFVTWGRSRDRLYVLFSRDDDETHRLVALDATTLVQVADSVTRGVLPANGGRTNLEIASTGIRVSWVRPCKENEDGCWMGETHAKGTVTKMQQNSVDDARGVDDSVPLPTSDFRLDDAHGALVSSTGRTVECPVRGTLMGSPLWVGRRMFLVTSGCCGGPKGGFFVCEVPE
jgi:hypothetical protein